MFHKGRIEANELDRHGAAEMEMRRFPKPFQSRDWAVSRASWVMAVNRSPSYDCGMGKLVLRVFGTWKTFVIAVLVFLYGVPGMLSDGAVWWGLTGEGLPFVPYVIATIGAVGIIAVAATYVHDQRSKSRAYEELAHHVSELKAWMDQSGVSPGQKAPARADVPANTASPKLPTEAAIALSASVTQ